MNIGKEIRNYIDSQPEPKREELEALHQLILQLAPAGPLWFLDGRNEQGKIVSNPNIGYGTYDIQYADGTTKAFYRVGISANTSGISVYIMGLKDKNHLADTYAKTIGKATVSGYCIKFKTLKNIQLDVLQEAIKTGLEQKR